MKYRHITLDELDRESSLIIPDVYSFCTSKKL